MFIHHYEKLDDRLRLLEVCHEPEMSEVFHPVQYFLLLKNSQCNVFTELVSTRERMTLLESFTVVAVLLL